MLPTNRGYSGWQTGQAVIPVAGWDVEHSTTISKPDVYVIKFIFSKNCQAAENPFPEVRFGEGVAQQIMLTTFGVLAFSTAIQVQYEKSHVTRPKVQICVSMFTRTGQYV